MLLKPITTEKAVKMIELDNVIVFSVDRKTRKAQIKKEVEEMFEVKVDRVNTQTVRNEKVAYVKLNKKNPAIDVATKLGMI